MKEDTRIALLEQSINHINETMLRIEKRFDTMDKRFDFLEARMDSGFKDVNNRLWANFFWMIGGFAGILAVIAKASEWI